MANACAGHLLAQVHFRPLRLEAYDDCIEFTTDTGSFVVPIKASIPQVSTQIPDNIDFGFCPVNETDTKTFLVTNDGEVPVSFHFTYDAPFVLEPASGSVAPRESAKIQASFSPTDASVFVADCVCTVPGYKSHVMKVGGIGKYPFITASAEKLECGRVLTGQAVTQHMKLRNCSLVYARFKIVRVANDTEPVFVFSPTSGIIPPDGELTIAMQFSPKVTGTFTSDRFEIHTPGGNTVPIECVGEAIGPEVEASKQIVNFNDVSIELPMKSSSRILELHNRSDIPVPFQLYGTEANGLFHASPAYGVLPPRLNAFINFVFSPTEPGNYYRRVYVLFLNASPIAIDLIGSGFNDKRRPLPIAPTFVHDYLRREARGMHRMSPEELQARASRRHEALERGEVIDEDDDAFDPTNSELAVTLDPSSEQALMRGLFRGSSWRQAAVFLEEDYIDFGAGSRLRPSEAKTVRVTNKTSGKLAIQWIVPPGYVKGSPKDRASPVFAITPSTCDVLPNTTASFKVQFRPQSDQQYYVQSLECFCSFKSMRTFRLVNEDNFALPWCLTLTASGDSFPVNAEQFIPRGLLSHRLLTFPAVHVGDAAYQTISIKNDNDTPMLFSISSDLPAAFGILPPVGLVPAGETQLLAVRFQPTDAIRYHTQAIVTLNNDGAAALSLTLIGTGCRAALSMPQKLFCPTACVGASSHACMRLSNPSRLPLAYEWDVPKRMCGQLTVDHPAGVLRGMESIDLVWSFSPAAERNYLVKVPCLVSALEDGVNGGGHEIVKQVLTVSGVGSTGAIMAEPAHLDYGTVLVGGVHRRTLTLINSSPVDLFYALTFVLESHSDNAAALTAEQLISCEQVEGLVPARNTVDVRVVLRPPHRETFELSVHCMLRPGASSGLGQTSEAEKSEPGAFLGPPRELCRISAIADFPQLQICDARLQGVSQELLWQQLRLPEINSELRGVLSEAELKILSNDSSSSMGDIASMQASLPLVDMMLPPGLPGDPPMVLNLLVRNVGELPAKFGIRYPTEMELQIEHWADKGEPSATELKQHLIVDKGILAVAPKSAELQPGQDCELVVRMRHFRADDYELPLLLQIASGRQLVLNVQGRTLALGERYLHIPLREIPLPPTPIGLPAPQRHTFELPNYSDLELPFEVQLEQMEALNRKNHNFPIFTCENPRGVIPPGGVAHVRLRFHPIEAKDYPVALPVALGSAGIRTFVILASGYHPREPHEYESYMAAQQALLPPAQQLVPTVQPMRLSFDRALFGQVPTGATMRKLLLLRNTHTMPCDFAWDTSHPLWGYILSVYPSHGTLAAGKHICCKLTLNAIGPPEELRTSLACALLPHIDPDALTETEQLAAAQAHSGSLGLLPPTHPLAEGTAMRPRSPPRLSVTEHRPKLRGLQALMHIEERESRRQAAAAGLTAHEYSTTAASQMAASAATLPPSATNHGFSNGTIAAPQKLYLDVRACVSPAETLALSRVDMNAFYVPKVHPPSEQPPAPSTGTSTSPSAVLPPLLAEQRETAEVLLATMLNELLKDSAVTRAIANVDVEPTPWMAQLTGAATPVVDGAVPPTSTTHPLDNRASFSGVPRLAVAVAASPLNVNGGPGDGVDGVAVKLDEEALEAQMEEADRMARAQRRAAEAARKRHEADESRRVRASTEFQELVAYVLEGTLFNLVSEVTYGEFALDTVPRQIVRSLEITQDGG